MGRKGFNWKARRVASTVIDNNPIKKIQIELNNDKGNYDECNALVLPSKKRKNKVQYAKEQTTKLLTKKQRKHLEKIVEKKKKKENRSSLLEALSNVQVTQEESKQLMSISSMQTKGLKKYFKELHTGSKQKRSHDDVIDNYKINTIAGSKRKKLNLLSYADNKSVINDPNIVGLENSDYDSDSEFEEREPEQKTAESIKIQADVKEAVNNETSEKSEDRVDLTKDEPMPSSDTIKNAPVIKTASDYKPAVFVSVDRTEEMQESRLKLPILAEEQQIMEKIKENPIVIIAGETGSGKTTQVPQFLFEAGYALNKMIAVTEPRRVAAISMSKRVAEEMNLSSEQISYLIRFEGNTTDNTKIKFMTDGVLLKEIQSDFLLKKYSIVILDEAHERSVYTDILIGLLSRIVLLRNKHRDPLKLIVMSATLRLADFTENKRLFKTTPPVIKVDSRQYPVTIHFNKRTNENYMKEALAKAIKIHNTLPDGGILIFVTGQLEVNQLVRRLRKSFPFKNKLAQADMTSESETEEHLKDVLKKKKKKEQSLPNIDLNDYAIAGEDEEIEEYNSDEESDEDVQVFHNSQPLWTLPLYSLLPNWKQAKVFEKPPEGCRLCVVSTNVAETSLTIPNMKYVVDTGKTKVKLYDKLTGVTSYQVCWTNKASANQRAGRAGRVGPGHCYRLYSSAVFNDTFQDFSVPEIHQKPVDDLYLQMKCMSIDRVVNFPFPSAPDLLQLKGAENRLQILGALNNGQVTSLGRAIAQFPVLPRFGKMLALSHQFDLLPYTICMVAALSVQEVLLETPLLVTDVEQAKYIRQKWYGVRRQWAGLGHSMLLGDPMVLLRAVGAAEYANTQGNLDRFCTENGLRHKAVVEIRKLRLQLTNEIKLSVPDSDVFVDPKLKPPSNTQAKLLRQILLAGMADQIAKKIHQDELKENEDKIKFKYAYRHVNMEEPIFLHSSSVLKKSLPEFVIYQEIYETNKMYMRGVTAIEPEWLPTYVPHLCNFCEPLSDPGPRYEPNDGNVYCHVSGTFGRQSWQLPTVQIQYPKNINLYKWFAKFLLEGKVFKKLSKYSDVLLSPPTTMIKSWAKLQPRTDVLLKALIAHDIISKKKLEETWKIQPQFLLYEYQKWLPESSHNEVVLVWPPLD